VGGFELASTAEMVDIRSEAKTTISNRLAFKELPSIKNMSKF
jgi:hypothetical protein